MKIPLRLLPVLALVAGLATLARGSANYYSGPDPSKTNAPAQGGKPKEGLCTQSGCHIDNSASVNTSGSLQILDLPDWYVPGRTYRLRVRLASTHTTSAVGRRWGFQMTAVRGSDGTGAGTFTVRGNQVAGPGGDTLWTQMGTGNFATRQYVEHLFEGTHYDQSSPVEWSFDWTAPASGMGTIRFYAAGNAGDGSEDPTGDWIYTTADSMQDTTTAVVSRSWGAIKQQWR